MDRQQLGNVLDLIDLTYPGKFKVSDPKVLMETWFNVLQEYEVGFVMNNLRQHIKSSPFVPSIHDLITDKSKTEPAGRYVPNAQDTYLELRRVEHEKRLALTTSVENVKSEQILQAKEKALRTIANAVKRSEDENPYKVEL